MRSYLYLQYFIQTIVPIFVVVSNNNKIYEYNSQNINNVKKAFFFIGNLQQKDFYKKKRKQNRKGKQVK